MIENVWRIIGKLPAEGYELFVKFIDTMLEVVESGDTETAMAEMERVLKAFAAKKAIRG